MRPMASSKRCMIPSSPARQHFDYSPLLARRAAAVTRYALQPSLKRFVGPEEGAHRLPGPRAGAPQCSGNGTRGAGRVGGPARGAAARQDEPLRGDHRPERGRSVAPAVGQPIPVRWALRLAPLVFVRLGELVAAEWAGIDLDGAEWRYTVTKTGRPHVAPLYTERLGSNPVNRPNRGGFPRLPEPSRSRVGRRQWHPRPPSEEPRARQIKVE